MKHTIENQQLRISVKEEGAELTSLVRKENNGEVLWQGDPAYWEGQSPVLFPTIGSSANQQVRFDGTTYPMPKHGLVKDMKFRLTDSGTDFLVFNVTDTEETRKHFPLPFQLSVRYQLEESTLRVSFVVGNSENQPLPYHVGAHPAFQLPRFQAQDEVHGYLGFDVTDKLVGNGLKPGGYLWPEGSFDVPLSEEGLLALGNHTFDCDTILDTRGFAHACTLYNIEKEKIATVRFDAPVLALWAPCGGQAPFVCIEPWWGCCDEAEFADEFLKRPWMNVVEPKSEKTISYTITVH